MVKLTKGVPPVGISVILTLLKLPPATPVAMKDAELLPVSTWLLTCVNPALFAPNKASDPTVLMLVKDRAINGKP
jgi:hypothetical protein